MSHSKFPLAINFTYVNVYVSRLFSQFVPPTSCPAIVHKSVYICVSIAALQIGSSVPSKCKLLCIAQQSIWPWPEFPALEKAMATHPSTLAWRILGTEEPDRLPSMSWTRLKRLSSSSIPSLNSHCSLLTLPSPSAVRQHSWGSPKAHSASSFCLCLCCLVHLPREHLYPF